VKNSTQHNEFNNAHMFLRRIKGCTYTEKNRKRCTLS